MDWNVPNVITGEARVRVTRGSSVDESDTNFTIVERPQNLRVNGVCYGASTFQIMWDSVPGATEYEVFLLGNKYMDSIGTTSNFQYDIMVPDLNTGYWFSVRALGSNGIRGLRQIAVEYNGGDSCYLHCIYPDDAGVGSIDSPGETLSLCGGITEVLVTVTLENIGTVSQSNFSVSYQLGTDPVVIEIYTGTLPAGSTTSHTFSTPLGVPAQGTYVFKSWTELSSDNTPCNDTLTQIITVQPPSVVTPFMEDLEGAVFPPAQAYIVNPDNSVTWEEDSGIVGAAGGTTEATYVNNYYYYAIGEEDYFYTIPVDLSGSLAAELTFDVSYRQFSATYSDQMRVDISVDCGDTYSQIYYKDGPTLATGADYFSNWSPGNANDWRNELVDLTPHTGGEIILRFVNINGYGNNLYLDNINVISTSSVGTDELEESFTWAIYPNPVQGQLTISLDQALSDVAGIQLVSLDGKVILADHLIAGNRSKVLTLEGAEPGLYLVLLEATNLSVVKRIVVVD